MRRKLLLVVLVFIAAVILSGSDAGTGTDSDTSLFYPYFPLYMDGVKAGTGVRDHRLWTIYRDERIPEEIPNSSYLMIEDYYIIIKNGKEYFGIPGEGLFDVSLLERLTDPEEEKKVEKWPDTRNQLHKIHSISASSFLIEEGERYGPENLLKRYYQNDFNIYCKPWVEGVKGVGIGEYLSVEFSEPITDLYILNGYVDPKNPKLYLENCRIKTVTLECVTEKNETLIMDATLKDIIEWGHISIGKGVVKVKIIIKDVYYGTKFQDTCVSGVYGDTM